VEVLVETTADETVLMTGTVAIGSH